MPPCRRRLGALVVLLALLVLVADAAAGADPATLPAAEPEAAATDPADTYQGAITVTATGTATAVSETPGKVDVVDRTEIEELGHTRLADLVAFLPGVEVEGDPTRLGANGFTVRGIGGNRVQTRIDGVPTSEQFDFGPLAVHQIGLDVDALERLEVVRSAGSALYGSDALGGAVELVTRSPASYLAGAPWHLGARLGHDGRGDEASGSLAAAAGGERWQGSLFVARRAGEALDNQGTVDTADGRRTTPNPLDRRHDSLLAKATHRATASSLFAGAVEWLDGETATEVLTARAPLSPFASAILDFDARDEQSRLRASLEHSLVLGRGAADSLHWRLFTQSADTEQRTDELRRDTVGELRRDSLLTFEQATVGARLELATGLGDGDRHLLTWGGAWQRDDFDQLRDRAETYLATGAPVPTSLAFPSKYFPASRVTASALFVQGQLQLAEGRLRVVGGARYDRYELDADQDDPIFLAGNPGTSAPADIEDAAVSPRLGLVWAASGRISFFAQIARGFRAPPMNEVNNGFTNAAGGYRSLPNPDLRPETSENLELGVRRTSTRGSASLTLLDNRYDDFIELVTLGFDPATRLVEFQSRNVGEVRIRGLELAAEQRFGRHLLGRLAYTRIAGDDETADQPLESIAPPRLVAGLRYQGASGRWGFQGLATHVDAKDEGDLPDGSTQFATPAYQVVDLSAWLDVTSWLTVQVSAWNLGDETYWPWTHARGQAAGATTLDRYTAPGRSFGAQARLRF